MEKLALTFLILATLSACVPEVEEADSLVVAERVIAIRSEPAEAAPRASVELQALYVSPDGTLQEGELRWAFCTARKALSELGPVNPLCLADEGEDLVELGEGLAAQGNVPAEACRLFGPDRPPPEMGEPAGRPVDPDPSGGYYQPVRVLDAEHGEVALYQARVRCGVPGAAQAQIVEYNQRYEDNENPVIEALRVRGEDGEELPDEGDEALRIEPEQTLELRLRWQDAESYAYFDPRERVVRDRREAMRVSWFSTGGHFDEARTGGTEQDDAAHSDNAFTAPDEEGEITLWTVLRDDRGGVSWRSFAVEVAR